MTLAEHAKWLRKAAAEIRDENHAGWGNTCEQAADAIDAHIAQHAETERQRNFWEDACDVTHNHWQAEIDKHAEMVAKLRELEGMWTQPIAASASFEERVRSSARVMCANQLEYRLLSSLDAQPATNVSESSSKLVGAVDVDARESE
jgi:hypothetical protein